LLLPEILVHGRKVAKNIPLRKTRTPAIGDEFKWNRLEFFVGDDQNSARSNQLLDRLEKGLVE
jgi:hypothetical protein